MTQLTRRPSVALVAVTALALLATTVAAPAVAGGTAPVVKSGTAGGKKVLVNARGRTLYVLTPETTKRVLCKSSSCLSSWPLLKTGRSTALKAGSGVKGRLGRLSRGGGTYQVTLRGLPLYTFAGDTRSGQATGEGLQSFGGTWHVVRPAG